MSDLTIYDAAQALGVHHQTIRRWISQGRIPAYRVGPRLIRVRRIDIEGLSRQIPAA